MQGMRTILRSSLGRSLRTLPEEDRLAASLPVVCGSALAAHCSVMELDDSRTLHLRVTSEDWHRSLLGMRDVLQRDLAQTAGVLLKGVELHVARPAAVRAKVGEVPEARAGRALSFKPTRARQERRLR